MLAFARRHGTERSLGDIATDAMSRWDVKILTEGSNCGAIVNLPVIDGLWRGPVLDEGEDTHSCEVVAVRGVGVLVSGSVLYLISQSSISKRYSQPSDSSLS